MSAYVMQALSAKRRAHLANVAQLKATLPDLEPDTAARAHWTLANLQSQIEQLDAQLLRNSQRAA
tara:strand:+ start:2392 stop:2586 length:195 start_codon:yes stop_codon:yes gene_type:complete